jgi:hypothetical protein
MRTLSVLVAFVAACARPPLPEPAAVAGARVYTGVVTPLGAAAPAFRYERWVQPTADGGQVATHVTWAASGGEPLVVQAATEDADGRLIAYHEVNRSIGRAAGTPRGDAVVGPTLFDHLRRQLPALRGGERVRLRFTGASGSARLAATLDGDVITLRPTSPLVRWALGPMAVHVAPDGHVTQYRGRIPPRLNGRPVDADVVYTAD